VAWGRKPKDTPPKVTPFNAGETKTFDPLTSPGYLCENVSSMAALLAIMEEKAASHPGCRMLTTLDDTHQAFYTSGHAIGKHARDLETAARGAIPTLAARRERLIELSRNVTLDQLLNRLWWTSEDRPSFFALQDEPDAILDHKDIYIQAVPVSHAWETVAAFPNGYFHGDFSPMENLVLARHLEETFGYQLFGIGASHLGFRRTSPLSAERLVDLASFIINLHAQSNEPDLPTKIQMTLEASDLLFLAYIDS
jgi:hypothetical protein